LFQTIQDPCLRTRTGDFNKSLSKLTVQDDYGTMLTMHHLQTILSLMSFVPLRSHCLTCMPDNLKYTKTFSLCLYMLDVLARIESKKFRTRRFILPISVSCWVFLQELQAHNLESIDSSSQTWYLIRLSCKKIITPRKLKH